MTDNPRLGPPLSSHHPGPTNSDSISSFLDYMQRRLAGFVASDSRSFSEMPRREPDDRPAQSPRDYTAEGDSAVTEEFTSQVPDNNPDLSNHHLNESPSLHRAGLLQPKSYNASSFPPPATDYIQPHRPDSIRAATVELSNLAFPASITSTGGGIGSFRSFYDMDPPPMALPPPVVGRSADNAGNDDASSGFIFPHTLPSGSLPSGSTSSLGLDLEPDQASILSPSMSSSFVRGIPSSGASASGSGSGLESSVMTLPSPESSGRKKNPSGLSLLRPPSASNPTSPASSRSSSLSSRDSPNVPASSESAAPPFSPIAHTETTPTATPMGTPRAPFHGLPPPVQSNVNHVHWRRPGSLAHQINSSTPSPSAIFHSPPPSNSVLDENTPLLSSQRLIDGDANENLEAQLSPEAQHQKLANGHDAHGLLRYMNRSGGRSDGGGGGDEGWSPRIALFSALNLFKQHLDKPRLKVDSTELKARMKNEIYRTPEHARTAVKAIPAVLLGCLLNILDGVSYGMIIFPATGVFADLGGMGVSMFFVSAIVAQLVYTLGGSGFAGANGSMMIEVVPFFHILATSIASQIGEDQPAAVIATTLVAYALSSVLTGLTFFLLGALKLGVVVGFFPRHILVGCIGGVGAFLIETGLTVSMRISDDDFDFTWKTFEFMFFNSHNLILWTIPLLLAILLRLITHKFHHQLIFPAYFIIIPIIFYIVVFAARIDLGDLRRAGWLFDMSASAEEPWYTFYNYFDFSLISYSALWSTLPTQFALLFFNILHPPLNVPALAVSLNNDVDTNKELVAHGYSNLLAGFVGTVPNYLVYVNTLLFYRVGGDNRIAGFLLAIATVVLLVVGSGPIAFIPVMVVGSLIFVLGIDLVKEALWDNRQRVTRSEYITIVSIMVCMTVWDFVIGVLFGIIVCCFFFVVQNSQLRSIRAIYTGDLAMSAVRRPSLQRAYIREVSKQTTILRLQGFLFFGTITHVEESIRKMLEAPYWHERPIQFLVVDLSLVGGIDMSAAEAFVRIHRLLEAKRITLVFCGFSADSTVGRALRSVEVLGARGVELFRTFSDAMEWTENAYLRAWFQSQKIEMSSNTLSVPTRADPDTEYSHLVGSFVRSPRRSHIRDAGDRTIATELAIQHHSDVNPEPLNTLAKAFSSYGNIDTLFFQPITKYLERISVAEGHILWNSGDPADGLYIIESGVLRAVYQFANPTQHFEESMVAGTLAGEMSALSDSPRNATVVAEAPSVLWKLSNQNIQRMQTEEPELSRVFMQLVLKAAKLDYDILLSAIASRQ